MQGNRNGLNPFPHIIYMIDVINNLLTQEQRKELVKRALYANSYFYKLEFDIISEAIKTPLYKANIGINRDFYLTEIMANFSDIFYATESLFNISIYTAFLHSIYNYSASNLLPSGFIAQDARLNTPIINEIFDDRQFEIFPTLIRNNDKIFAEIRNLADKAENIDGYIILKGFNLNKDIYISDREMQQILKSLEQPVRKQYFSLDIEHTGQQTLVQSNDDTPRMVLGFGITNDDSEKELSSVATVSIRDTSRKINLTDSAIPIQFIAPRMRSTQDTHLYYLPIEHYWQPFGNLEFNINNTPVVGGGDGFKLSFLTRNV